MAPRENGGLRGKLRHMRAMHTRYQRRPKYVDSPPKVECFKPGIAGREAFMPRLIAFEVSP